MSIKLSWFFPKHLRSDFLFLCIIQGKLCWNSHSLIVCLHRDHCLIFLDFCCGKIIIHNVFRAVQKIYVPENPAHTEFILIFQIGSVAPLQNQNCQSIFSIYQNPCHVKFTGGMRNLTVACILPIYPHIKTGIHTLKIQICLWSFF